LHPFLRKHKIVKNCRRQEKTWKGKKRGRGRYHFRPKADSTCLNNIQVALIFPMLLSKTHPPKQMKKFSLCQLITLAFLVPITYGQPISFQVEQSWFLAEHMLK
jgi:hypothetical protein